MTSRYGRERILRGLLHFVLGKGVSAIAGMFAILLVIRSLSIESFAAYSVLVALVEMLTAISGLGLAHALLRYVPELYANHYQISLRNFVYGAIGLRSVVMLLAAILAYLFSDKLAPHIGLGSVVMAFQVFLLVVVLRSTTQFLSQILESTLHQGNAQLGFASAQLIRLLGMLYLLQQGQVKLVDVIWVEVISDALSLIVMLIGVIRVVRVSGEANSDAGDNGNWLRIHLKQVAKFALAGYVQHLAITPYGGHTNRLVGGGMLNTGSMASYGFAQSIYEYMKRFLPAQLLVGLIRPVVVARYSERQDFSVAASMCGQVLQINILLIVGMLALLVVVGSEALAAISAGKYGPESLIILTMLFLVLLLETQRQQLELLVQTVERYHYLIASNLLLASSVLLAVVLIPWLGAVAFPAANSLGLIVANAWVQRHMKSAGFHFTHDWFSTFRVMVLFGIAVFFGEVVKYFGLWWYFSAAITALVYTILAYVVSGGMVRGFMRDLTEKNKIQFPVLNEDLPATTLRIAFGVLSSKQSAQAIDEIAASVFPHPVYVHHDFSKQPDFAPKSSNIHIIQHPVATAWGDWSLVEASFLLMKAAMGDAEVTHFQLLSEACLPVRPIHEFEIYLSKQRPDVMIDIISLQDDAAMFSHGWRYFQNSQKILRLLRRLSSWIWGTQLNFRPALSVNLRLAGTETGIYFRIRRVAGQMILRIFGRTKLETLSVNGLKQFAIGGQWFGASRRGVMWILNARNELVDVTRHFQRSHIPDESYFQTLFLNAQLAGLPLRVYPSNHALFWDSCGNGPDMLHEQDLERIRLSGKFFARKFSLFSDDAIRRLFTGSAH
jgi:O-antigen/teichoic acid export membrane protein